MTHGDVCCLLSTFSITCLHLFQLCPTSTWPKVEKGPNGKKDILDSKEALPSISSLPASCRLSPISQERYLKTIFQSVYPSENEPTCAYTSSPFSFPRPPPPPLRLYRKERHGLP